MSVPLAERVMPERCATCAFRPGTEASADLVTRAKATLCVDLPDRFECHEEDALCAGWHAAVAAKVERGHYAREPEWKRDARLALLDFIGEMELLSSAVSRDWSPELRRRLEAIGSAA